MGEFNKKNYGVGIGLRRENSPELVEQTPSQIDCLEIAPENYVGSGGRYYRELQVLAERYPIIFHAISLSIGSLHSLNREFLKEIKSLNKVFKTPWMSDHLCYSSLWGYQFHDLLPLPFTREAVEHVVPRIRFLQDYFEMPFAVENISFYAHVGEPEMNEWDFLTEVVGRADCSLLLDVNNVYVNSRNFGFDPHRYLESIPMERVLQVHVAGHQKMDDFILDNHGAPVIHPVWDLLGEVFRRTEVPAVIIERDHRIPPLAESVKEVEHAKAVIRQAGQVIPAEAGIQLESARFPLSQE